MVFIYVLELEQGKYYVGKTNDPDFRLNCHFNSNGSTWTKIYAPINVLVCIPNCDDYDEDKYTIIYMDKYGIDNVRGGSFVSVKLDKSTIDHLTKMSNCVSNKCFGCGAKGHFIKDCNDRLNKSKKLEPKINIIKSSDTENNIKDISGFDLEFQKRKNTCWTYANIVKFMNKSIIYMKFIEKYVTK